MDSGADYTILPRRHVRDLGLPPAREARLLPGEGIGGREPVPFVRRWAFRLGPWERPIPLGFLLNDRVPPLLGRMGCLDAFKVTLFRRRTAFAGR